MTPHHTTNKLPVSFGVARLPSPTSLDPSPLSLERSYLTRLSPFPSPFYLWLQCSGSSTEWDDIQRRLRNLPPKPEIFKPPHFTPSEDPDLRHKSKECIDKRTVEEFEGLEDDPDINDNRFLEEYRKQRLAEMQGQLGLLGSNQCF